MRSGGGEGRVQPEGLRPGHPHGGSHLDHGGDLRVRQGVQHAARCRPGPVRAPVGQWVTHWPQKAQSEFLSVRL